jgi:hypothetical protein
MNAFLSLYNECRTEEEIMKILDDWGMDEVYYGQHIHKMKNQKYHFDRVVACFEKHKAEYEAYLGERFLLQNLVI